MSEKANPSINRNIDAFQTAGAIAYGGHTDEGFVIDGASPTELSIQDPDISDADLNTFAETSSASSFDVTIDAGEAFVFGSWVAVDTTTNVTLASSTSGQTVYVGWNKDGSDDVIVGLTSTFDNATGNTDQKIPLFDFDTDGSGVTSVTDRREVGQFINADHLAADEQIDLPVYSDSTNAPPIEGSIIFIDGTGTEVEGVYSYDGATYVKSGNTEEAVEDIVAALLAGGTNITLNYDDANDTLTINGPTNVATVDGPDGNTHFAGSLPRFADASTGESNTSEGDIFYNDADNSLYLNDGT